MVATSRLLKVGFLLTLAVLVLVLAMPGSSSGQFRKTLPPPPQVPVLSSKQKWETALLPTTEHA